MPRIRPVLVALGLVMWGIPACSGGSSGIDKIDHVIIILRENRSFDSYFGTFPGVDGIPMKDGVPTVCIPNSALGTCLRPFHDPNDRNLGGPHNYDSAIADVNGGRMDGFIDTAYSEPLGLLNGARGPAGRARVRTCRREPALTICAHPDLMGYHDQREIPNYWSYARNFALQDHMFEPNWGPSEPAHLYLVSGWSARCSNPHDPFTCKTNLQMPDPEGPRQQDNLPDYGWTDLTYLLYRNKVSWAYYIDPSDRPDCDITHAFCGKSQRLIGTPSIWNPLRDFVTVHQNHQLGNIRDVSNFLRDLKEGHLPSVTWIMPDAANSEHPPSSISTGQAYVTRLINAIGRSSVWDKSVIFLTWDDWGGFYDHVPPPKADHNGYGLRVPSIVIGPYVKRGYIDHQTLSFDAYLKFVEDRFLGGQRIDPKTDGRPDPRPTVREDAKILGDITKAFDFSQDPRPPLILPPYPNQE
jgi:phospholipase C